MAIGTDSAIEYFGTQDLITAVGGTSAVTDGSFSVAADVDSTWSNDDDAPIGGFVLNVDYITAPDANTVVHLYARLMNIEGTNDAPVPTDNYPNIYVGSWAVKDVTTAEYYPMTNPKIPQMASGQVVEWYIKNSTGQTMPAGWKIWATLKTYGPHA